MNRRSFSRISLRAFMLFATVVMVACGFFLPRVQRQRMAVQTIEKNGGSVFYDYQFRDGYRDADAKSRVPDWILQQLGPDFFHRVIQVNVNYRVVNGGVQNSQEDIAESWSALVELTSVKRLQVDFGECSVESFRNIQRLKNLESIQIWNVALGDQSMTYLENLSELRTISISGGGLSDASLEVFARLPKLESLKLYGNAFSNEALAAISAAPVLVELTLNGEGSTIDDNGLPHLSKLKRLKKLGLQHSLITDAGLQHFVPMKSIKEFRIGKTNVTWFAADQFKKTKRPDVTFQGGGLITGRE